MIKDVPQSDDEIPAHREKPYLVAAVAEYNELVEVVETASDRMGKKTQGMRYYTFVHKFTGDTAYGSDSRIWVAEVENLDRIPFPSTVYHVTGGSVLEVFNNGGKLTPEEAHYINRVDTDKGLALHLVPTFMRAIGIDTGCLQEFLFSGPQVDSEQIKHYQEMAGSDLNQKITELFLQKIGEDGYVLSLDLKEILDTLSQKKIPFEDLRLKGLVDKFVADLFNLAHIREGWLEQIKNRLYGLTPINRNYIWQLSEGIEEVLSTSHFMYKDRSQLTPQLPVVLAINTRKLIEKTAVNGLFPVLIGGRPIETIFASMNIIPEAVEKVYVHPDQKVPQGLKILVATLDDLPDETWLGGVKWREAELNMDNPLCAIRYVKGKRTTWFDIAKSGLVAPAILIEQSSITISPACFIDLFGEENFSFTNYPGYKKYPVLYQEELNRAFWTINGVFSRRNEFLQVNQ